MREDVEGGGDVAGTEADVAVGGGGVSVIVGVDVTVGLIVKVGIGVFVESDG